MIGEVTRHILPHLAGVPHLHVNRSLYKTWEMREGSQSQKYKIKEARLILQSGIYIYIYIYIYIFFYYFFYYYYFHNYLGRHGLLLGLTSNEEV